MARTNVILPKLGLTMDEGKIVSWHKREGDAVAAGEILFEVETDKANVEVEAPASGVLRRVLVGEGAVAPVASTIAIITGTADEDLGPDSPAGLRPAPQPATSLVVGGSGASTADGERVRSSPAARKRAQELGVDVGALSGTGPGGRVTIEDVEAAAKRPSGPVAGERRVPLTPMRRAIADAMTRSAAVPQFRIERDADMTAADAARRRAGVSYTDVLVAACAAALRAHERFRSRFDRDALVVSESVDIGVAVALEDGLIVPVIRAADRLDLAAIRETRERLEQAAHAGKLPAGAVGGAVFSISNLGTLGVDRFGALVSPPEAAILAVGRVSEAKRLTLTLSVDHRVADGADAARFLADVVTSLGSMA